MEHIPENQSIPATRLQPVYLPTNQPTNQNHLQTSSASQTRYRPWTPTEIPKWKERETKGKKIRHRPKYHDLAIITSLSPAIVYLEKERKPPRGSCGSRKNRRYRRGQSPASCLTSLIRIDPNRTEPTRTQSNQGGCLDVCMYRWMNE